MVSASECGMASVLITTTILNIVVSVFIHAERQPLLSVSRNGQLRYNDQEDIDRRMVSIKGGNQVKQDEHNSNMAGNEQSKKIDKRSIIFLINQRTAPETLFRMPKTTQNPFIPETNIDDYDIGGSAEVENVPRVSDSSAIDSHQLVRMTQDLFKFSKLIKQKSVLIDPIEKSPNIIRVKRKMSEFRRDRKQITRKKKIGRRKKTKVRRLAVKKRKWYDKRQKVKKKGDGTYRGGRGRIPRQHKRPRHYKPPKNESSVYDYYDDDGKVKVAPGETQEGSEGAEYVEYGTGEYQDTAEAEAAQQELEKEYQMQLVKERRRKLMNGTISSEESMYHTNESVSYYTDSDSNGQESEYDTKDNDTDEDTSSDPISNNAGGSKPKKNTRTLGKNRRQKRQLHETEINKYDDARKQRNNIISISNIPFVQNSVNMRPIPRNNKIPSDPVKSSLQNTQSITQQQEENIMSMTKSEITSVGGAEMYDLKFKRASIGIESVSNGKQITSITGDKPETSMILTSSVKDSRKRITSIRKGNFRKIQSMAVDPLVLTSIAKDMPDLEEEKANRKVYEKTTWEKFKRIEGDEGDKLLSDKNNNRVSFKVKDKSKLSNNQNLFTLKKRSDRYVRSAPISKQEFSGSYEELSNIPHGVGLSAPSDEIEPASD